MKRLVALSLLLLVSGCKKSSTAPTDTTTPYSQDEVFSGTLAPQGTQFYSFVVAQAATVNITMASMTATGTKTTLSAPVNLAVGTPLTDGTACSTTGTPTSVSPALVAQVTQQMAAGTFCVSLTDVGGLPTTVDFGVRIDQSASVTPIGSASPETFSTNVYPLSGVMHTFGVVAKGTVAVYLTRATPAASLGIGLGVPTTGGGDCAFNTTIVTQPNGSGNVNANVDPGVYCVKVFDPGSLSGQVNFQVSINHP